MPSKPLILMEPPIGVEPTTFRLRIERSIIRVDTVHYEHQQLSGSFVIFDLFGLRLITVKYGSERTSRVLLRVPEKR
jgi:hypothetical protein